MKKKVLALLLSAVLISANAIPVLATPNDTKLNEGRQKYAEIESKISDIENKIYDLNVQIEPLQVTVDKNKRDIVNINNVIDNTTKDIDQCKEEITSLDKALGERVNAMYKAGDLEFSYMNFLLESESTSDFFSRVQAISKIVSKDKKSIEEVVGKKEDLNNKIKSLEDKKTEIDKLNQEVQSSLKDLDEKKKEQEVLVNDAKNEKSKFDSEYLSELEKEVVKPQYDVIENSNSTSSDIKSAIQQLKSIRDNQLKSEIVKKEVEDKISIAQSKYNDKKKEEEAAARAAAARAEQARQSTASNYTPSRGRSNSSSSSSHASGSSSDILNEAYKHLGKPYVWGATGTQTFDCSGFTQYVFKHAAGTDISRTTYTQINEGTPVSKGDLQPGDLVFTHAGHVGIYAGNGQMIHAPQTGDVVKISPVYKFYAARRIN